MSNSGHPDLWFWSRARRGLPRPVRALVNKGLILSESATESILAVFHQPGKSIPAPPVKFRALVHGGWIDAAGHASIGREVFGLLRDHCGLGSSSFVLDIGCGCGRVATPIAAYLKDGVYHGVDIVKPMVDWCKANISTRAARFHFHHADLSNTFYRVEGQPADRYIFPFPDGAFDVVFATSVFTHLVPASANQYAKEVARLLKPKSGRGLLTFFLLNDEFRCRRKEAKLDFRYRCDGYCVVDRNNPEAVVAYEEADASAMLRNASLSIEQLSLGQWSQNPGWTFQDAFVVSKQ
jgi:SAM-dependent methyltransferase